MDLNALIEAAKGITGSGDTIGRMAELMNKEFNLTLDPGDFIAAKGNRTISMAAPVSQDLWYLFNHSNLMTWVDASQDPATYFNTRLAFFSTKLHGIKAMKGIKSAGEVTFNVIKTYFSSYKEWENTAKPWIQVMAFELLMKGQPFYYPCEDPIPENVVGYITFPTGQLGLMEVISLVLESDTDASDFSMKFDEYPNTETPTLFPPLNKWELNKCYGRHLVESMYVVPDKEKRLFHTQSKPGMPEVIYGKDVQPKGWMRLWIERSDVFPTPGEFVGILCKPNPLPPHCWWFQDSTPFVYAGNWMDTHNLTSGIITSITEDQIHPVSNASCTKYGIKIHGQSIYAYSSDFLEYEVNDRVGVLKLTSIYPDVTDSAFDWNDQKNYGDPVVGETSTEYVIIPIEFFKEV